MSKTEGTDANIQARRTEKARQAFSMPFNMAAVYGTALLSLVFVRILFFRPTLNILIILPI